MFNEVLGTLLSAQICLRSFVRKVCICLDSPCLLQNGIHLVLNEINEDKQNYVTLSCSIKVAHLELQFILFLSS